MQDLRRACLTRISHQLSTAAADPGMSTALRSVGLLDILSSMPAGPLETNIFTLGAKRQAPCRLRCLATKSGEKCGLIDVFVAAAAFEADDSALIQFSNHADNLLLRDFHIPDFHRSKDVHILFHHLYRAT
jgi:hypothetical protein